MKIVKKLWGWELILVSTELYACKLLILKGGYQCSIHYHKEKDETFVLLVGRVFLDTFLSTPKPYWEMEMKSLKSYHIIPTRKHRFKGKSSYSVLLEVSTEDKSTDSYRETKSGKIYCR